MHRIFISYSHRGNGPDWKRRLLQALAVFERQHLLDVWEDGKIRVSAAWNDTIEDAMRSASLAVLLLTPEALESEYIRTKELKFLRERWEKEKIPVFPVVCEACEWKEKEESKWLHAIQSPAGAEPLASFRDAVGDRHLRDLATAIAEELSGIALAEDSTPRVPPSEGDFRLYLEKFPLTRGPGLREERLIGREQELALLSLAFVQPQTAIVSLVAWGGVGKTMLVQHWLQRLQREGWLGARRVYAWSFYSQGTKEDRQASEDTFLAHALGWFGVQCEPTLSPWDKGRLLADAVARERTLLILDGIEPLQYPPGPMGGRLRAPGVQSLLKYLARTAQNFPPSPSFAESRKQNGERAGVRCLCLVTTRESLTDLADFQRREGSPWGSVLRVDLGNLTDEAGAALLHHAGANRAGAAPINPDDKELLAASSEVDGHALTLILLGPFLARAHSGDIRQRDLVKFEEADRKEQGGTTFKMLAAFENWFTDEGDIESRALSILRLLGLFDRPADAGSLDALRNPPVIAGLSKPLFTLKRNPTTGQIAEEALSDKAWNDAIHFLTEFGLVNKGVGENQLLIDCHPLIREYFSKGLKSNSPESWRLGNHRIYEYLTNTAEFQPDTLEVLELLYQAIAHGCHAGLYQEVFDSVYQNRVLRGMEGYSWRALGAFASEVRTVVNFFVEPWRKVVPEVSHFAKACLFGQAGFCLQAVGRAKEALFPLEKALEEICRVRDLPNMSIAAANLCNAQLLLGKVSNAEKVARRAVDFIEAFPGAFEEIPFEPYGRGGVPAASIRITGKAWLGHCLHQAGKRKESEAQFRESEAIQRNQGEIWYPFLVSRGGFQFCELLLSKVERAVWKFALNPSVRPNWKATKAFNWVDLLSNVMTRTHMDFSANISMVHRLPELSRELALNNLMLGQCATYLSVAFSPSSGWPAKTRAAMHHLSEAHKHARCSGQQDWIPSVLLSSAWLHYLERELGHSIHCLDEAWDIAERGPMLLHMADIYLYRARLFYREKEYPWREGRNLNGEWVTNRTAADDLAAAEKFINECGYHRRDQELADAKQKIMA